MSSTRATGWAVVRGEAAAVVPIVVGIVAFFSPVWATGRLFVSDGQYTSFLAPAANWSIAWVGGWPQGADTAAFVWYPVRLLLRPFGFNAFMVCAYLLAALGTYAYLRVLELSRFSAAFGGVGFALSGFMIAHLLHNSMVHAAAWVPWMFAAVEGCLVRDARRWAVLAAVAVAMSCLAGHMQITFYGLACVGAYLLWRFAACRRAGALRGWAIAWAGLGLGILLAAPQLLMTVAYVRETPRAELDYASFVAYSLPLANLPTVLFPFLFGENHRAFFVPYFGPENFAELCLYLPFVSLVLAGPGALRARRGVGGFWAIVAVVGLLLALGGSLPALAAILYRVPGFNQFRVPARHLLEVALAVNVLAAFGAEWLAQERSRRARTWLGLLTLLLAGAAIAMGVDAHRDAVVLATMAKARMAQEWAKDPAMRFAVLTILVGCVALAALATRTRVGLAVFALGAALGIGSYAWFADWRLTTTGGPPVPSPPEQDIAARLAEGGGRILHADGGWGSPFTAGRARAFGMPSLNWYGPLLPIRAQQLLRMTPNGIVPAEAFALVNTTLDVYGVRFVAIGVMPGLENGPKRFALQPPRWNLVSRSRTTSVFENARALPLAWLTPTWRETPPDEARQLLQSGPSFDPRREALVEGLPSGGNADAAVGTVAARWTGEGRIDVDADAPAGGFLVVSANGVTGWTATVDGVAVPVHRADYALMGVPLAAGRHAVRFEFRTPTWQWLVPWGAAFLGFAALAWAGRPRSP
jgi:hypothetical protein